VPTRREVFSQIPYRRLRHLATQLLNDAPRSKAALIEALVDCRWQSVAHILEQLTVPELRHVARALSITPARCAKGELIARISGDDKRLLQSRIITSLRSQGFRVHADRISLPHDIDKDGIRALHRDAVAHRREAAGRYLAKKEHSLLEWIADGATLCVEQIDPILIEVQPDSVEELVFRYAALHWEIPVSSGYGRRLRFLVVDQSNDKLMGIIGLGDPVFALAPRDRWIGWNASDRRQRLHHVIDAYALGAVPPYSHLLSGKLVALLAASTEVRERFKDKYGGKPAVISGSKRPGDVALITTTSALGRSSVYNRLRFHRDTVYHRVGFTKGSGDFQFLNGMYEEIARFAGETLTPTAKNDLWGTGFRNRREVVKKTLAALGLKQDFLYHGVEREIFVVPTAANSCEFLQGKAVELQYFNRSVADLVSWYRTRWLVPRAERQPEFRSFRREDYRLWP